MEHMDNYVAPWNNKPNVNQSEDKESDAGAEEIQEILTQILMR